MGFANERGLLLYDGSRWALMPSPGGQTLRSLIYDETTSSWLTGAYDAWYRWPHTSVHAASTSPELIRPPAGPREEWWHVLPDPNVEGAYLWQTFSRMARLDPRSGEATPIEVPGNIMFAQCIRDTVVLPTLHRGLFVLDDMQWLARSEPELFADRTIVGLVPGGDDADGILIALRDGAIFRLSGGEVVVWPERGAAPWADAILNGILQLRDGRYALATVNEGVYILTAGGDLAYRVSGEALGSSGAPAAMFEDEAGDLWIALEDRIVYVDLSAGVATLGLENGATNALLNVDGHLLMATSAGLVSAALPLQSNHVGEPLGGQPAWHITKTSTGEVIMGDNVTTYQLERPVGTDPKLTPIGSLAGGYCWMQLDSMHAVAGTYIGFEAYERTDGRWKSLGALSGYGAPVERIAASDELGIYNATHPQEGEFRVRFDLVEGTVTQLSEPVESSDSRSYSREFNAQQSTLQIRVAPTGTQLATLHDTVDLGIVGQLVRPSIEALPDNQYAIGLPRGVAVVANPQQVRSDLRSRKKPKVRAAVTVASRGATINLTQPRYSRPPRFRIQLSGVDSMLGPWSERSTYQYPLLPHGDYQLDWMSEDGQRGAVQWEIAPRWYQTQFAYLLYILTGVLLVVGTRIYYRRRLASQQRRADVERERQLHTERLRTRAAALEAEVQKSRREAALASAEAEHRNRELAQSTVALAKQKDTLLQVRKALEPLPKSGPVGKARRQLTHLLEQHLNAEEDWSAFQEQFDIVHTGFLQRLQHEHPDLSSGDLRLASLLRMNLTSKEISPLLHISLRGVENKRYRLRKKLGLSGEVNLVEWILAF